MQGMNNANIITRGYSEITKVFSYENQPLNTKLEPLSSRI